MLALLSVINDIAIEVVKRRRKYRLLLLLYYCSRWRIIIHL